MATVTYGALNLVPAPELGIAINSKFFGADIRYARSKTYSLRGTILSNQTSGVSGIYTLQNQIVTGFQPNYLPFYINGTLIGYPQVKTISFDNSPLIQKDAYSIELEFLDSGNPFQITGINYGFTGVSGLFYNLESLTENLDYTTDFKTYSYAHSVDVVYRSGFNVDPLFNAKLIASGLINNKTAFPFITSGGPSGIKVYEEKIDQFGGNYSVTEKFHGTTGNSPFTHLYALRLELDTNGITSVSQEGEIQGYDPNKYLNAKNGYATVTLDIFNNCQSFYLRNLSGALNNTYLSDTRTDDLNLGKITYARSFTDETGVSDVRWQYTQSIELDENFVKASENGSIIGLGHITTRFATASGAWNVVRTGIEGRILDQFSGQGLTGQLYNVGRSQTYNRFEGSIGYGYDYSNRNVYNLGSGIRLLETTVSDQIPIHAVVNFNVINAGVLVQDLFTTKPGQRTVSADIIALRDTSKDTLFQFTTNVCNGYRPTGTTFIDPYLSRLNINYSPLVNSLKCEAVYDYNGLRTISGLDL